MTKNDYLHIHNLKVAMNSLTIYREILKDTVMARYYRLIDYISKENIDFSNALKAYSSFVYELYNAKLEDRTSFCEYLACKILYDENPFSRLCESIKLKDMDSVMLSSAKNDLFYLQMVCGSSSAPIKSILAELCMGDEFKSGVVSALPSWDTIFENANIESFADPALKMFCTGQPWNELVESLYEFHRKNGTGMFARYSTFIWEHSPSGFQGYLRGISKPDPVRLEELIGYELERGEVISNTIQFLKGYNANNILLYGDRGTGKSSTVKAIANEYCHNNLRLIEVPKSHLADFHQIIRLLKPRKQRFIIFIDDLVFEDNEENYTALKAVLEGGIESKPENVLIYATTNRRHLIKENFSDRLGLQSDNHDDEIRAADTIQEKLSLSDRFGITVVFSTPNKNRYLQIVKGIATKRGLKYDASYIEKEALKWELWYNGRSPRTARQFIDWLEGQDMIES